MIPRWAAKGEEVVILLIMYLFIHLRVVARNTDKGACDRRP